MGYGDCRGPDLGEMMRKMDRWAGTWLLGRRVIAKVDAVVEGHEEGVGIPTTRVNNRLEPYRGRRLQFPNYSRPIISFSKMERHGDVMRRRTGTRRRCHSGKKKIKMVS